MNLRSSNLNIIDGTGSLPANGYITPTVPTIYEYQQIPVDTWIPLPVSLLTTNYDSLNEEMKLWFIVRSNTDITKPNITSFRITKSATSLLSNYIYNTNVTIYSNM